MGVSRIRVFRTRIIRARECRVRKCRVWGGAPWRAVRHRLLIRKLGVLVDGQADAGEATGPGIGQPLADDVAVGFQLAQRRADGGRAVGAAADEVGDADLPVIWTAEEVGHQALGLPREVGVLGNAPVDPGVGVVAVPLAADDRLRHGGVLRSGSHRFGYLHHRVGIGAVQGTTPGQIRGV